MADCLSSRLENRSLFFYTCTDIITRLGRLTLCSVGETTSTCLQCPSIIAHLLHEERGCTAICPLCHHRLLKGTQWVLDGEGFPMNEDWEKSDRPVYCTHCAWHGTVSSTAYLEDDCFHHRCPKCGAVVANRKGEE